MSDFPEHYPEEYIHGEVTFYSKTYRVTPAVLIPRLETEGLVRRARELLKDHKYAQVIDLGCGSGIIGTSVADLVDELIFIDLSPAALTLAEGNFRAHFPEKNAQFIIGDLLDPLVGVLSSESSLILTNLPYIKAADWDHMSEDTHYEPEMALFGGEDTGFELYEKLFVQLANLEARGSRLDCIIEFGYDQREIAEDAVKKYPDWHYAFFADYAGIERFCHIQIR